MNDDNFGVPGYGLIDPSSFTNPEFENWSQEKWRAEFSKTHNDLLTFLRVRDPFAVLAKTSMRFMLEAGRERSSVAQKELPPIEQAEVELVQALLLAQDQPHRRAPTSPGNFIRCWHLLGRHISCFIQKQSNAAHKNPIEDLIVYRARIHTIHYRNLFTKENCEETLLSLLARIDRISEHDLGYKLSDAYRTMLRVLDIVARRLEEFGNHISGDFALIYRSNEIGPRGPEFCLTGGQGRNRT